jgi:hypothetical protein
MKKIIFLCLVALTACNTPKQKGLVYFNDFDAIKGWAPVNLSKKVVHSGLYSNKIDSSYVYGMTFKQLFREVSDDKIIKVKASFWTYLTDKAKGMFVVEVRNHDNKQVLWVYKDLKDVAPKHNEWQKAEMSFTFADSISKPENSILIYPWSTGKGDFYVDDLKLEFVLGY